jgi:hypothetical protein
MDRLPDETIEYVQRRADGLVVPEHLLSADELVDAALKRAPVLAHYDCQRLGLATRFECTFSKLNWAERWRVLFGGLIQFRLHLEDNRNGHPEVMGAGRRVIPKRVFYATQAREEREGHLE